MKIKTWQRPVSSNTLTFASATETLLVAQGKYQPSRTPLSLLSPFNLGKKINIRARFWTWILVNVVTDGKLEIYFHG